MEDLIQREDAIKWFEPYADRGLKIPVETVIQNLKDIPSAENKGEWIDRGWHGDWQFETDGRGNFWREYECSECGFNSKGSKSNFCPDCGVRMVK